MNLIVLNELLMVSTRSMLLIAFYHTSNEGGQFQAANFKRPFGLLNRDARKHVVNVLLLKKKLCG